MLEPLRHRDFRLLWIGQSVSTIGNALYGVALPFQILALKGSPLQLGTGFAIFSGAQLLSILFGGALVDRLPRRRVILASDLASGIVVGLIAILGFTGRLQIAHLYIASAFSGLAFSFYTPAISAIMPELVPKDILVAGNALRGLGRQAGRVFGPLIGGIIVSTAGPPAAFAIDAATFIFSFVIFVFANPPKRDLPPPASLVSQIREGVAFTFSVNWLWVSIVGFGIANAFYLASFTVALPILVLKVLMGSAATYGLIGAFAGIGELIGGLLVGNLRFRRLGPAIYAFNAFIGLSLAGFAIAPLLIVVLVSAAAFNVGIVVANTLWDSALQKHVPAGLIGRVSSVDNFGSFLVGPVAPILAATIIQSFGPSALFLIGGVVSVVFWVVAFTLVRSVRELE
jgi:predicted MFS family arabinose efflux permease